MRVALTYWALLSVGCILGLFIGAINRKSAEPTPNLAERYNAVIPPHPSFN